MNFLYVGIQWGSGNKTDTAVNSGTFARPDSQITETTIPIETFGTRAELKDDPRVPFGEIR